MPVAGTGSAKEDPMPVAKGGEFRVDKSGIVHVPEPMPVAKSGCWNPLSPVP